MEYDAILFDNDGVLVTPTRAEMLRPAARAAFADVGISDPDPTHVEDLMFGVSPDWLREVCAGYDVAVDSVWTCRDERASQAQRAAIRAEEKTSYEDVPVLEGLAERYDLGIVSTNQHQTIEFVLEYFGLASHFETYYGREPSVESLHLKKPNPHYVERALSDLGTENALFVGDSESDLQAAANAGIDSAFVRRSHCDDTDLAVEPTISIESLTELLPG